MDEALGLNPNTSVNESMNERISKQNVWLGTLPRDAVLVLGLLLYRKVLLHIPHHRLSHLWDLLTLKNVLLY